jgi:hypothetical protein
VTERGVEIFDNFGLAFHCLLRSSAQGKRSEAELVRPARNMAGDLAGSIQKIKERNQATFAPRVAARVSRRALSIISRIERTQRPHCGTQPRCL